MLSDPVRLGALVRQPTGNLAVTCLGHLANFLFLGGFLELRAAISVARLRANQNRRAEGHDLLAPIYNWFTEVFDTADLKDAKALLDDLA